MTQAAPKLTPVGTAVTAGTLTLTVADVQFGDEAFATIQASNKGNEAAPEGLVWGLANVSVSNNGQADVVVNASDFCAAGPDGVLRRPPQMETPQDTLQAIVKPGESAKGWIPFQVTEARNVVMLFDSPFLGGNWANAWFALTDGATLSLPEPGPDPAKGTSPDAPAAFGETVRTGGFDVTVLEHANGQAVLDMATLGLQYLSWGEDLSTWNAFRVRVTNISNRPLFFSYTALRIADAQGEPWDHLMMLSAPIPDAAKMLVPGATYEGWQAIKTEAWATLQTLRVKPFTQRDDARYYTFAGDPVADQVASGTPTATQPPTPFKSGDVVKLTDTPVYLRETASSKGKVVKELDGTSTLTVTGDSVSADGHTWYPVTVDATGESGFVAADFLALASQT